MAKFLISGFLFLSILVLIPGCGKQPIRVSQQIFANKDKLPHGFSKNKKFVIAGGKYLINNTEQVNSLFSVELEKKLNLALSNEGYFLTPLAEATDETDYIIAYKYGIRARKEVAYEPQPVYGSLLASSTSAIYNTVTYVPVERTYYTKFLEIIVGDLKQYIATGKVTTPIWQAEAWIVDECNDLRTNLDFIIIQLTKMFGQDSAGTINSDLFDDNKSVGWLRSVYANPMEK